MPLKLKCTRSNQAFLRLYLKQSPRCFLTTPSLPTKRWRKLDTDDDVLHKEEIIHDLARLHDEAPQRQRGGLSSHNVHHRDSVLQRHHVDHMLGRVKVHQLQLVEDRLHHQGPPDDHPPHVLTNNISTANPAHVLPLHRVHRPVRLIIKREPGPQHHLALVQRLQRARGPGLIRHLVNGQVLKPGRALVPHCHHDPPAQQPQI